MRLNHRQARITMKTQNLIAAGIISAGITFGVTAQTYHQETQDLPTAVQTTIKDQAGNDQILRIEKETRKGKECYEAIVNKDGRERDGRKISRYSRGKNGPRKSRKG